MAAQAGDTVKIHYKGTLDDGSVFDSSEGREPLGFRLGTGQVIQGFDDAVRGMNVGERKTVRIPPGEAYGEARDDLFLVVERRQLPSETPLELGASLTIQQPDGRPVPVSVSAMDDDTVTLNANHPLAGQALTFALELVSIE